MYRMTSHAASLGPHILAAGAALYYAWLLSQTALNTTGVQFLSPLIVILLAHMGWAALRRDLAAGFAPRLVARSARTAALLVLALVLGSVFAPMPAEAAGAGEVLQTVLIVFVCAMMIGLVVGFAALVLYLLVKVVAFFRSQSGEDDGPRSRLFDFGTIIACCAALGLASLEGMPRGYAFAQEGVATSTHFVPVPPDQVWTAMGTATSPDFPLPDILASFPRPVAVSRDEGVGLNANRVVRFEGREGAGALHLRVTKRTDRMSEFTALSDSTPYASWIGFERLRYAVVPAGAGTRLSVTLEFERKLAPAWFFGPVMRGASYFAADVLARDTAARASSGGI